MKLHEKIKDLRKNRLKLSLKEFHKKLQGIYGDEALTYDSLSRIEKGYRDSPRIASLSMICTGLGISLKELKEGTEEEKEESKIANIITSRDRRYSKYIYNEKAEAVLGPKDLKFLAMELTLLPLGATTKEQDPVDVNRIEKLVIMLQGEILAYIGSEKHLIKKGDMLSFASNIPHHFENPSKKVKARCIIVQNPKSY